MERKLGIKRGLSLSMAPHFVTMFIHYILGVTLVVQGCLAWESRIINGKPANPHQYPYQVALFLSVPGVITNRFYCGGVVIGPEWILTAGQCIPKIGWLTVKAGKHYIDRDEAGEEDREVIKYIRHKDYRGPILNQILAKNDIALLKLNESLTFDDFVRPIDLPEPNKVHTGVGYLSGWGSVSHNIIPQYPQELQSVELSIIDNESCSAAINAARSDKSILPIGIRKGQICTGSIGENFGACARDTGSGFVQFDVNQNKYELIGIVSWARFPCGKPGVPTIYTRVSEYIDWIVENQSDL